MSESTVENVRRGQSPADILETETPVLETVDGGRWRWVTVPVVIMAMAVALYVWYFTKRSLDIHHALGTSSYDSAQRWAGISSAACFAVVSERQQVVARVIKPADTRDLQVQARLRR